MNSVTDLPFFHLENEVYRKSPSAFHVSSKVATTANAIIEEVKSIYQQDIMPEPLIQTSLQYKIAEEMKWEGDADDIFEFKENHDFAGSAMTPLVHRVAWQIASEKDISEKSSCMWTCKRYRSDENGDGGIYEFEWKKEYDFITPAVMGNNEEAQQALEKYNQRQREIFPNIQPVMQYVLSLLADYKTCQKFHEQCPYLNEYIDDLQSRYDQHRVARELGYACVNKNNRFYLRLLTEQALQARWYKYCYSHCNNKLPALRILSCAGLLSPLDFVKALLTHDVVLSEDEFIHDHTVHVIGTVNRILQMAQKGRQKYLPYGEEVQQLYKDIILVKEQLEQGGNVTIENEKKKLVAKHIDKIAIALSAAVDIYSSLFDDENHSCLEDQLQYVFYHAKNWIPLWEKIFGESKPSPTEFKEVLKDVRDVAAQVRKKTHLSIHAVSK